MVTNYDLNLISISLDILTFLFEIFYHALKLVQIFSWLLHDDQTPPEVPTWYMMWYQYIMWHVIETLSPEGTFCDTVQVPSGAGDMQLA